MYAFDETGDGFGLWEDTRDICTNTDVKIATDCELMYLHAHMGLKCDRKCEICIFSCVRLIIEKLKMDGDRQTELQK